MHILITGGCGFVGAQLALHLKSRGHCVLAMDNLVRRGSERNISRLKRHGIEFVHGDVRNREDFAVLPRSLDFVCDTSAQPSVVAGYANPVFDFTNNTFGVVNVLEFVRQRGCPLIFWSTNRVYSADKVNAFPIREDETRFRWDCEAFRHQMNGRTVEGFDPAFGFSEKFSVDGSNRSLYGLSKLMADLACQEYAQAYDLKVVVNRFGVLSGEGQFGKTDQGWVVWWAVAHWFGLPLKYLGWNGKQVRDILFIEDLCRLVDVQIEHLDRISGEVFNVGGGEANSLSLVEATALLQKKLQRKIPISYEETPRQADTCLYVTDNRKIERMLGWKPRVGIAEGYDRILAWIEENEAELREFYVANVPESLRKAGG
ncbi:MAG TPA: NAD-dependent epimerase/dehydratase family protein [Candidatus Dormibacteraeota bacterium]|nr:NAD-dependent epimerase/dehydratase family protein [Candidatus Dormibacteraeota bacterium]